MSAALLLSASMAYAQEEKPEYVFQPHWFINVQGGAQHTLGEAKFGDLISPNVQLGVGYQFNPWLGLRLAANAWQSKGGWNGYKVTPSSPAETKTYKYNYVAPGFDVMFNLSNAICGFNPKRVLNVTAFVGGGANVAFGNDEANDLAKAGYDLRYNWEGTKVRAVGRGGLALDFRLSDAVSLGVEGNANILNDRYNSKKAGNADWYFNALVGLKINLGKNYKKVETEEPTPAPEPVVEEKPAPEVPVQKEEPKVVENIQRDVFFKINSAYVRPAEEAKVVEISDYMKANADKKLTITGYADVKTGTAAYNKRISMRRAEAVKKLLVKKYGIDESRIKVEAKGSSVQPFSVNEENRVSICLTED